MSKNYILKKKCTQTYINISYMEKERNWCLKKQKMCFAAFLLLLFQCFILKQKPKKNTKHKKLFIHSMKLAFAKYYHPWQPLFISASPSGHFALSLIRTIPLYLTLFGAHFLSVALCTHDTLHDMCYAMPLYACVSACLFDSLSDAADLSMSQRYHSYNKYV